MNIIKTMATAASAAIMLMASSCDVIIVDAEKELELEVNANNISGKWQLMEWNNATLAEGTYVYLDIVRNDKTYVMYQNLDSFSGVPHVVTGSYYIETDPELGAIIRGNYDYDSGDWVHRYVVTSLTSNQMIWVAKDDETFVQTYLRVDSIPVAPVED